MPVLLRSPHALLRSLRPPSLGRRHLFSSTCTSPSNPPPRLKVLALESSADDSCAAIVTSQREVLANVVLKQHDVNARFGGIHPLEAQHRHAANMPIAIRQALSEAQLSLADLDAIAYTRGPGMAGCLGICAASAKALAAAAGKPLIGIHHMQAHALTPLLTESDPPAYPFLTLLVSGGHTQLVLATSLHHFKILADCLDQRIGDAFDKTARLLALPPSSTTHPGALLAQYASLPPLPPYSSSTNTLPPFPTPLDGPRRTELAFSFSGLTSHVERLVRSLPSVGEAERRQVARLFQEAAVGHVVRKVRLCLQGLKNKGAEVRGLVVSGGVASNVYLREQLKDLLEEIDPSIELYYPPVSLCTDNAAMIAWTAILRIQDNPQLLEGDGDGFDLPIRAKWSLEDLYDDLKR